MLEDWQKGGFGLYIHWPFCAAKCPYCDFNSHVSRTIDHAAWAKEYLGEIDRAARETSGRVLSSVFFGGGTPSLMKPSTVDKILDKIATCWPIANDLEVTLEANPTSVEADRFAEFGSAGVNRVSVGIQALNDSDLRALGRMHTANEGLAALDIAARTFDRVSFDLIYGRQNQSASDWEKEISRALQLGFDHLSLYQLTIEPGTAFADRYNAGKLRGLPDDGAYADMYELTNQICSAHGLNRYEVSNHARAGAESKHNLIYWRYGDYLGIGPGAHGRLTIQNQRYATVQESYPTKWLTGLSRETREPITREETAAEFLLMGLRLKEGIELDRFATILGTELNPKTVIELQDLGLVSQSENRLSVTTDGFILLDTIIQKILP